MKTAGTRRADEPFETVEANRSHLVLETTSQFAAYVMGNWCANVPDIVFSFGFALAIGFLLNLGECCSFIKKCQDDSPWHNKCSKCSKYSKSTKASRV